jgi:hypothetical protein
MKAVAHALVGLLLLAAHAGAQRAQRARPLVGGPLPSGGAGTVRAATKIDDATPGFEGALEDLAAFGAALAHLGDLDGDGIGELAVGEPGIDTDLPPVSHGAVRILFLEPDGTVRAHQRIGAGQGGFAGAIDLHDDFGYAVAALGDLDLDGVGDLAVGAGRDDDGGGPVSQNRGAVWVLFLHSDGTVKSHAKISASSGGFTGTLDANDIFGSSVAALGDLDGDGVTELAVGAGGDDDGGTLAVSDHGAVWILFLQRDGSVKAHAKISDTAGDFGGAFDREDFFGSTVAALGDLDRDGVRDLAVGVPADDDGGGLVSNRGAVWLLALHPDGTVKSEHKISATEGGFQGPIGDGHFFGSALATLGDLDCDGFADLAVGASGEGFNRGAVWILFLGPGGSIRREVRIADGAGGFFGGLGATDTFGGALALLDDRDGDGVRELVVGAFRDADTGFRRGAVWLLALDGLARLDFETADDFLTPLANGRAVASPGEFGRLVSVASAGANLGAAAFDSTPGGPNDPSQDPDLLVANGNLLILQNSLVPTQTIPGVFDRPNDDQDGGTFHFTFATPVEPCSVALVDIDMGAAQSASVTLVDAAGALRTYSVPAGWTGDRQSDGVVGIGILDLRTLEPQPGFRSTASAAQSPGFQQDAVVRIDIDLGSSGAIDDLCFDSQR